MSGITFYFFPTPNTRKITIALEEMALSYEIVPINIVRGEQLTPEFLEVSPNGRIPALVDEGSDGRRIKIFESGAILQHLGRKSGLFYPQSETERAWVDAWLFWQVGGLGPMAGQINWFVRASERPDRDPRDSAYAIRRYVKETRRLYGVLERQLSGLEYICDAYSIADMACWPWVDQYNHSIGGLGEYPNIAAWRTRMAGRSAVRRAMQVGAGWTADGPPAALVEPGATT